MKMLKNIAVLLLLVAFMLPASGLMLFWHHCQSMETMEVSLDGTNSCCANPVKLFRSVEHNDCSIEHPDNCTDHTFFKNESCCEDGHTFVKISNEYLATFSQIIQPFFTAIDLFDHQTPSPIFLNGLISENTDHYFAPPGRDTWLLVSSLRL
ncbi:MAG: hypothetical protein RBS07_07115 [Lentimicrobium sp.]|jgi:hypothetical protein|nr:hypothetical protein [Lentimicrobium sp.]